MPDTTASGATVPEGGDSVNIPGAFVTYDASKDPRLTTAQIAALPWADKPAGWRAYDTTLGKIVKSTGGAMVELTEGGPYLPLAGGKMTGDIEVEKDDAALILDAAAGDTPQVLLQKAGVTRFGIALNVGLGALTITRYNTSGVAVDIPLSVRLDNGAVQSGSHIGGVHTGTTTSGGLLTITLPTSPTGNWAVTAMGVGTVGVTVTVAFIASTYCAVNVLGADGNPVVSTPLSVHWHAIAY